LLLPQKPDAVSGDCSHASASPDERAVTRLAESNGECGVQVPSSSGLNFIQPDSDGHFRQLLEGLPAAIYATDPEGRISFFNDAAVELWGRTPTLGDLWCGSFQIYKLDGSPMPLDQCPMALALREGRSVRGVEIVIERPDGSRRNILSHPDPIRDASGTIVGAMNMLVDITEQKIAERNRVLLAAIGESSEDAIISKNLDGVVSSWNRGAERLFGYRSEEMIGQPILRLIPPERHDEERVILDRLRRGERIEHYETVRVARNGRRIEISLTISPVRDGNGHIIGVSKVARDITERKRVEETLRDMGRRKDEFLAVLAHELRNPLAPLRSSLQLMRMAMTDRHAVDHALGVMERQLQQMVRLIDDLLDVSRISRGMITLRKESVSMSDVLESAVETIRPAIDAAGQELHLSLPTPPIFVDADATRLAQIFANLLSNAAKYTWRGGRIDLAMNLQGSCVAVSVKDNGVGIPANMLQKVFDMFIRVDGSLEKTQGGLGIGLTLVKQLVEMHGGTIEARSEGYCVGSEFIVRMPVIQSSQSKPVESVAAPTPGVPHRILIVDDHPDSATSLAMMLQMEGHQTQTAFDGMEAVRVAGEFRPDVILLDIGMPKLNGYDTCRIIRAQPWGKDLTIVALTGWGQDEDRRRSKAAGFNHHLIKPVEPAVLVKLLAGVSPPSS
jgi:PAS domain S-box-containing protein